MTAKIIDGSQIAGEIRAELSGQVQRLKEKGITPGLTVIMVGDDPAIAAYVRNKERASAEVGIYGRTFKLPRDTKEGELLSIIDEINHDSTCHGLIVQLPLPPETGADEKKVTEAISPHKDVDGLHPVNVGKLLLGEPNFLPCTPAGVQQLLLRSGYSPERKHVVICGRSNLVGRPLAAILLQKAPGANATVTVCHTGTKDLAYHTRQADILVVAAGRPRTITADMVREGVVVIDVGINYVPDPSRRSGRHMVGDVDFEEVKEKAEAITPVPGGVGPMTVAMLLHNTVKAALQQIREG